MVSLRGVAMSVRFVANLILSSPTWADTIRLHCSETLYDKALSKPYDVPEVFILRTTLHFVGIIKRWTSR
jgi:hypothetical protein